MFEQCDSASIQTRPLLWIQPAPAADLKIGGDVRVQPSLLSVSVPRHNLILARCTGHCSV
jgi:hypothetical protein